MASPDERQGDRTATTTCYICNELPNSGHAAAADLPLRSTESAKSASSRIVATGAEEGEVAPVTVLPDDAPDQSAIELGER
jgi:hypothetical protein